MKEQARIIRVEGTVFSGAGEGAKFARLPWFKRQILDKIGFVPYEGTLNLRLDGENLKARKVLEEANPIIIIPKEGYCYGKCFKAYIDGLAEGAVVVPQVENYPKDVLEIIAPVNLREKLGLKDGDRLRISILLE